MYAIVVDFSFSWSTPVANEWRGYPTVRLATLALYAGLIVGAVFWGTTCDVWGYVIVFSCLNKVDSH